MRKQVRQHGALRGQIVAGVADKMARIVRQSRRALRQPGDEKVLNVEVLGEGEEVEIEEWDGESEDGECLQEVGD